MKNLDERRSINFKMFRIGSQVDEIENIVDKINKCNFIDSGNIEGFNNVQLLDNNAVSGEFIGRENFLIKAINDNVESDLEFQRFVTSEFIIIQDILLVSGSLYKKICVEICKLLKTNMKQIKFNNDQMKEFEDKAYTIKQTKFKKIPGSITQLTLFGDMETIFGLSNNHLSLYQAEIDNIKAIYFIDNSNINVKINSKGHINIKKPKGRIIDVNLIFNVLTELEIF